MHKNFATTGIGLLEKIFFHNFHSSCFHVKTGYINSADDFPVCHDGTCKNLNFNYHTSFNEYEVKRNRDNLQS